MPDIKPLEPVDEPQGLPCAGALVAGTVALMTVWADPCPNCTTDLAAQRLTLARQIVSNLSLMETHPALGPELQQVMAQARQRWLKLAHNGAHDTAASAGDAVGSPPGAAAMALH